MGRVRIMSAVAAAAAIITCSGCDPHKAADLAERGVQVCEADYDQPETLVPAFTGASKLLLIPSAVYGQRYPRCSARSRPRPRPAWA
jgi:hypothetical protein